MSGKALVRHGLPILLVLMLVGSGALALYFDSLPQRISQHETIVLGQNRLVPGSTAGLRVVVRDSKDGAPLSEADIRVALAPATGGRPVTLFSGVSDAEGNVDVSFRVPEEADPDQTLIIETSSALGEDKLERPVTLARDYRVLLTTDKPIYQPGQVIHLRALALGAFDQRPAADQPLELLIADAKGNKVFRQTLSTSAFGVASVDFQLASQVNTGPYKISATLGNSVSEKTVTVEHYVLPKFDVNLNTERPYYRPGEHVAATLDAAYFFGKVVDKAEVKLEGFTFDVDRTIVLSLEGATDEQGRMSFDFDLPDYMAGSDLDGGTGRFYLHAMVTDKTGHSEEADLSFPVSASELIIEAVPEGGMLQPGMENILYVLTSYPDGSPAGTSVSVKSWDSGEVIRAETGQYGLAEVIISPLYQWERIQIEARGASGAAAIREFNMEGEWQGGSGEVILRPERPIYRVGETMKLTVLTSQPQGTVYLDIVREGQTVSTRALPVSDGRAELAVDLSPDLYGTLEMHAYKILASGSIVRDTRLVLVDAAADLDLALIPDQEVYRPGEIVALDIRTTGSNGFGVPAAVGLAVVDEAVFALAEQDPGFAKLYFMLEAELLEPKYDLHGFSVPDLISDEPVSDLLLRDAQVGAAKASLAEAAAGTAAMSLQANSHEDAVRHAETLRDDCLGGLSNGIAAMSVLVPLVMLGLGLVTAWRKKRLWRTLGLAIAALVAMAIVVLLILWLSIWFEVLTVILLLILAVAGLVGLVALAIHARRRQDSGLGWTLGLFFLLVALLLLLAFISSRGGADPDDIVLVIALIALLCVPLAFTVRLAGFGLARERGPAWASLGVAVFLVALLGATTGLSAMAPMSLAGGPAGFVADGAWEMEEFALEVQKEMLAEPQAASRGLGGETGAEPPRLRQYFPETMLWLPGLETDETGALAIDFPVADSITTWRMTALASSQDGRLGSATAGLRVFQDFFIDLDLPLALTVGDEVSIPVGIFNYLPEGQTVLLELEPADWYELLDDASKEVEIPANEISVVHFRLRALDFGRHPVQVTAWGSQMSDAIKKEVHVYPNGKQIHFTYSDLLNAGEAVEQVIPIPTEVLAGTQELLVKIYPGVVSQVVEGLDSILRMPYGCFEQTSSTTYPNVLVLDYLRTTSQASPEVQFKAEEYINLGYQRLTTFEVASSGGFSLFGDVPADRMLTAYGLQEFADMSRVHHVDPALISRAVEWLLSQQAADGSWENDRGLVHESTWSNLANDRLPVTAYVAWSLVEAGYGEDSGTRRGLEYVNEFQDQAEDPYVATLVANALVAADVMVSSGKQSPATERALERLAGMAVQDGDSVSWPSGVATFMGSEGQTGSIETTALAALVFLRANRYPDLANGALASLVRDKDSYGTWHSTQATVLALKALIESVRSGAENVDATVSITLNAGQSRTVQVTPENFDVVQMVTFDDLRPAADNLVSITVEGEGNLMYQVAGSYYLPWDALTLYPELVGGEELVSIDVAYDRTELAVDDTAIVDVTVTLNEAGRVDWALIDLGVPPGFAVQAEDLAALVARYDDIPEDYAFPTIERYELTGRQILVYVGNLGSDHPLEFSYRLRARYPLRAQTPVSGAYDYYNPEVNGEAQPEMLVVVE